MSVNRSMWRHLCDDLAIVGNGLSGAFWTLCAWAFGKRQPGSVRLGYRIWRVWR